MRLGALMAVTILVLVTLVSAFPQVVSTQDSARANIEDHMTFTRELAAQSVKLSNLEEQHRAMLGVPAQLAVMEERLTLYGRMILAILAAVFTLLAKEMWNTIKSVMTRSQNKDVL